MTVVETGVYECRIPVLDNYFYNKDEAISTEMFVLCNFSWRLKIFPNGRFNSAENHTSVFLNKLKNIENSSSRKKTTKTQFSFTLMNQIFPGEDFQMNFDNELYKFREGSEFGSNEFAEAAFVLNPANGFLANGSLILRVQLHVFSEDLPDLHSSVDNIAPPQPSMPMIEHDLDGFVPAFSEGTFNFDDPINFFSPPVTLKYDYNIAPSLVPTTMSVPTFQVIEGTPFEGPMMTAPQSYQHQYQQPNDFQLSTLQSLPSSASFATATTMATDNTPAFANSSSSTSMASNFTRAEYVTTDATAAITTGSTTKKQTREKEYFRNYRRVRRLKELNSTCMGCLWVDKTHHKQLSIPYTIKTPEQNSFHVLPHCSACDFYHVISQKPNGTYFDREKQETVECRDPDLKPPHEAMHVDRWIKNFVFSESILEDFLDRLSDGKI